MIESPEEHTARVLKTRAQAAAGRAIRAGLIVRPPACSRCSCDCKPHAHHDDYTKPLDVRFVCQSCHVALHVERGDFARAAEKSKRTRRWHAENPGRRIYPARRAERLAFRASRKAA